MSPQRRRPTVAAVDRADDRVCNQIDAQRSSAGGHAASAAEPIDRSPATTAHPAAASGAATAGCCVLCPYHVPLRRWILPDRPASFAELVDLGHIDTATLAVPLLDVDREETSYTEVDL